MFNWKKLGVITGLSLSLVVAGCSSDENQTVSEQMNFEITGLEPGAGQTELNNQVIEEYENLADWEQTTSSTGAMLSALDEAYQKEEPIMITAWSPHYMFAKWDLKYLEDPKGIFGQEQHATTITRLDLKEDMPDAYEILDRIHFEVPEIEAALLKANEEGLEIEEVAQIWVEENQDTVNTWIEGIDPVDGTSIDLISTQWDEVFFTGNVARIVLEQHGYDAKLTPVDPAVLFVSIANGEADASLSPWIPTTHGALYEEYEGRFEDLGANFEGAKIGLAVPTYMEEDSLEDFEPAEED
ncbi:glycine betaine ABC transporter substrate-binding protein [Ornithinibacillus halotolerans]|uniref:Glycine/betaine ABC transporter substrate-binding protein n=1 Tax=Ornithinibacillus halotolerans TaxID=1274357 RepID=A0A916SDC3_9BACI|nr:glycine betaine ABC transporter substrate-binding protein [Ornithinibacillus halotolerans]GGA92066.1 glycine/betaine ABC transporter substrate-binding protein [Ornithinibacillus halotolerans]